MSGLFDVTATLRLPGEGKATVTFDGPHARPVELTEDERRTIEDLLIGITARRQSGRHA